jgi:hypothetical protein
VDLEQEQPRHAAQPGLGDGAARERAAGDAHRRGVLALHGLVEVFDPLVGGWGGLVEFG